MKTNDVPDNTDTNTFEYRRVSGARLAFAMMHAASISCFASAIGYVSYAANLGFGISALLVGTLMTLARGDRPADFHARRQNQYKIWKNPNLYVRGLAD